MGAGIFADFWQRNHGWATALISLAVAGALAAAADRFLFRRGRHLAESMSRGALTPQADTRLRVTRRLVVAGIILVGVAVAASQFAGLGRLANSLLASSAIVAAVVGFAARQTLANVIAGVMLAITQPLRVGDWVCFGEHYGVVDDIRLNYTFLRTAAGQQVVIPNEQLAAGVLRNDTLGAGVVALEVSVWIPADADADAAIAALAATTGAGASVSEVTPGGVRLSVSGPLAAPHERAGLESRLRADCLRRLRADGLLAGFTPPPTNP